MYTAAPCPRASCKTLATSAVCDGAAPVGDVFGNIGSVVGTIAEGAGGLFEGLGGFADMAAGALEGMDLGGMDF